MIYVPDTGPFGYGTPPRTSEGFSRECGFVVPAQCPGTTDVIEYSEAIITEDYFSQNVTWDNIDLRIPKVLAELYQSGLKKQSKSVSSFFDIQTRQYGYSQKDDYMQNKTYQVTAFQYLSTIILNDAVESFEGLVVDTKRGAAGYVPFLDSAP